MTAHQPPASPPAAPTTAVGLGPTPRQRRVGLAGVGPLIRLDLRRDRFRNPLWVVAVVVLVLVSAASIRALYPTQADLDQAAAAAAGNAAAIAFNGPVQGLDTLGGEVAFQAGALGLVLVALMSLLTVGRYTRAEEESGRAELLRAAVLGRHAATAAALAVVAGMNLLVGLGVGIGLLAQGLPATGSVVFAASFPVVGILFAAVALVTAQMTGSSRVASGWAGLVLGWAFAARAVGDARGGGLSWLSPIGWAQKTRPYAGERWWPFLICGLAVVVLLGAAARLTARRDWGSGLMAARPGPAGASPRLGRPLGLALRLNRAAVAAWAAAMAVLGFVYGALAHDIDSFVSDNQTLRDIMAAAGGGSLTRAYLGTALAILGLIACWLPVQTIQRLRSEESALRAELVLSTPASRRRWMGSQLAVAAGGSAVTVLAAGLGVAVPYALATGEASWLPRLVGDALCYLPAIWLVAGVAAALFGLVPRLFAAVWVWLTGCLVVGFLGAVLKPSHWLADLSPVQHVPELPAASFRLMPLVVELGLAIALGLVGVTGLARRDVG